MAADDLTDLRREIDEIDNHILDLLKHRAAIGERIKTAKSGAGLRLRPGREAQVLRALIHRNDGLYPPPQLVRIWREIMTASLHTQGPMALAVPEFEGQAEANRVFWDLARGHFGAFTKIQRFGSARRIIEVVLGDQFPVGILPAPTPQDTDPWWRYLAVQGSAAGDGRPPRVIAKLPFAGPGSALDPSLEAVAIARDEAEPSGDDCTLLVLDLPRSTAADQLAGLVTRHQMAGTLTARWHDDTVPERWLHLMEITDYVGVGDARLDALTAMLGPDLNQLIVIGGYATPLGPAAALPAG